MSTLKAQHDFFFIIIYFLCELYKLILLPSQLELLSGGSLQQSFVLIHIILQTPRLGRAFQIGIIQGLKAFIDRSYLFRTLILIDKSYMNIFFVMQTTKKT